MRQVDFRLLVEDCLQPWVGKACALSQSIRRRLKKGELFPAFLMISLTDNCNLNCQGCWVSIDNKSKGMDVDTLNNVIESGKEERVLFLSDSARRRTFNVSSLI